MEELIAYVRERYKKIYPDAEENEFDNLWDLYQELKPAKINENVWDVNPELAKDIFNEIRDKIITITRLAAGFYIKKSFEAMKIDLEDPNVAENWEEGNIGTPQRISKMWVGSSLDDDSELMCGRWAKRPRLATFPNEHKKKIPIVKRIDINAVCSHHAAIFSSQWHKDAYAIVAYIPNEYVLGISKLQRVVDWIARRGWLQEDLTKAIYEAVSEAAQTESVYVKLHGIIHSCEKNRGAQTSDGFFNTEYYGGDFDDPELRKQVDLNI